MTRVSVGVDYHQFYVAAWARTDPSRMVMFADGMVNALGAGGIGVSTVRQWGSVPVEVERHPADPGPAGAEWEAVSEVDLVTDDEEDVVLASYSSAPAEPDPGPLTSGPGLWRVRVAGRGRAGEETEEYRIDVWPTRTAAGLRTLRRDGRSTANEAGWPLSPEEFAEVTPPAVTGRAAVERRLTLPTAPVPANPPRGASLETTAGPLGSTVVTLRAEDVPAGLAPFLAASFTWWLNDLAARAPGPVGDPLQREELATRLRLSHLHNEWTPDGRVALLDPDLAEALLDADAAALSRIAREAAHQAVSLTGIAELPWVAETLAALDEGRPPPPPWDDPQALAARVAADRDLVPHDPAPPLFPVQPWEREPATYTFAVEAVAVVADHPGDPAHAAWVALARAAAAAGRLRYPAVLTTARATLGLPPFLAP